MIVKILNHNGKIFHKPNNENPWNSFFKEFEKIGFEIITNRFKFKYDILICNGHISKIRMLLIRLFVRPKFIHLILWEPIQTNPQIYRQNFLNNFNYIFSPSPKWITGKNVRFFNWPQGTDVAPIQSFKEWSQRINKVACIYANKFSIINGELYSLRRKVLIDPKIIENIDLYGRNWNRSSLWNYYQLMKCFFRSNLDYKSMQSLKNVNLNFENYRGSVSDKPEMIGKFRISLIIENSSNYVSEKLFDALVSQSIAVYVGIDLSQIGLSSDLAIQVDQDSELIVEEISRVIQLSSKEQYDVYINQQAAFRKYLYEWNNNFVFSKIAMEICNLSII